MKKIIGILIALAIVVAGTIFIILNNNKKEENKNIVNDNNQNETTEVKEEVKTNSKTLVVYFSMPGEVYNVGEVEVGNTAIMASYIKDYLKADSFELLAVKEYSRVYKELIEDAKEEQERGDRPEIKNKIENFDQYDTVFIGYPIWWGDLPPILYTFMESYNFNNKNVYLFNTHEGSGSAGTHESVKSKLQNAKVNTNGLAVQGKVARTEEGKDETIKWLKSLGF